MRSYFLSLFPATIAFGLLINCSVHAQHKKAPNSTSQQSQTATSKKVDVYVGGYFRPEGGKPIARYLKNGVAVSLTNGQYDAEITEMAINGRDVYAAGFHNGQAVYWKNGAEVQLTQPPCSGSVSSMVIHNGDVYIAGYKRRKSTGQGSDTDMPYWIDVATYWKNGQEVQLTNGQRPAAATAITVDGTGDIYVSGVVDHKTKFWKNKGEVEAIDETAKNITPLAMSVLKGNLYIAGFAYDAQKQTEVPAYWQSGKGVVTLASDGIKKNCNARITSMKVTGDNIYAAGSDCGKPKYWTNGIATELSGSFDYPGKYSLSVAGKDVYVAGWGAEGAEYWKNGQPVVVTNLLSAPNCIIAVSDAGYQPSEEKITGTKKTDLAVGKKQNVSNEVRTSNESNRIKSEDQRFLDDNKKRPEVITTASGLQYQVINKGNGAKPTINDKVKVHYRGTLINGTEFDNTKSRGEPVTLRLTQTIAGFGEGLQLMPVGSTYKFYIPAQLAYGNTGAGGIKPGAVVIYEVDLLAAEK